MLRAAGASRIAGRALCALLVSIQSLQARDYPRDHAALRMINRAVNEHYLRTEFDRAESILLGTIKACEQKCSPSTLARAWMYVGIVRETSQGDRAGAREAFKNAFANDPKVELDADLAIAETREDFAAVQSEVAEVSPPVATSQTPDPPTAQDDHPICPPGLPGCIAEGDICRQSEECQGRLVCLRDADDGRKRCGVPRSEPKPPERKLVRHWLGAAVAVDFALAPAEPNACTATSRYRCYVGSTPYAVDNETDGPAIAAGMARGATRFLVTYTYALDENLLLGARAGIALGSAPQSFMPHGELRVQLMFGSWQLRPFLLAAAGVAQVDAPVSLNANTATAYAAFGRQFVAAGGGLALLLSEQMRVEASIPALLLLPETGMALMPSLGLGFSP